MTPPRDHEVAPVVIDRRQLLTRAGGAVAGLTGVGLLAGAAPALALGSALNLSDFGAAGDGSTDDTAAIQAALNAAGQGTTVMGVRGAVYLITNTISFPTDLVTLNLGGGAVRIGRNRQGGSALQANDTMFSINGRNGVRITNGTIMSGLSGFGGSMGYRIHIVGGLGCKVDNLTAACDGSQFVFLSGNAHSINSNTIDRGGISGVATNAVSVSGNTLTNSPADAINFTGYAGAPVVGTSYTNNVISGYGRVAIEEHSEAGATNCVAPIITGNTISAPSASNSSGTGISAISTGATITNNSITDAAAWAIEATGLGTTVTNNTIGWTSQDSQAARESTAIVINGSLQTSTNPVAVAGNTIKGGLIGIQLYGGTFYCPVTIQSNQITNTISQAIVLTQSIADGMIQVIGNTINFDQQPQAANPRFGIIPAQGAVLTGNQVLYTTASYKSGAYDIPYLFTSNGVAMTGNTADGGGRSDPYIGSGDLGGYWTGWKLTGNRFVNGAPGHLSGLAYPLSIGNAGLS